MDSGIGKRTKVSNKEAKTRFLRGGISDRTIRYEWPWQKLIQGRAGTLLSQGGNLERIWLAGIVVFVVRIGVANKCCLL